MANDCTHKEVVNAAVVHEIDERKRGRNKLIFKL
jgi:hypothetical protein